VAEGPSRMIRELAPSPWPTEAERWPRCGRDGHPPRPGGQRVAGGPFSRRSVQGGQTAFPWGLGRAARRPPLIMCGREPMRAFSFPLSWRRRGQYLTTRAQLLAYVRNDAQACITGRRRSNIFDRW
jgi:hypothetical protein